MSHDVIPFSPLRQDCRTCQAEILAARLDVAEQELRVAAAAATSAGGMDNAEQLTNSNAISSLMDAAMIDFSSLSLMLFQQFSNAALLN